MLRLIPIITMVITLAALPNTAAVDPVPQSPSEELEILQDALETQKERKTSLELQAIELSKSVADTRDKIIKLTLDINNREREIVTLHQGVSGLEVEFQKNQTILDQYSRHLSNSIAALVGLRSGPPPILAILPDESKRSHLQVVSFTILLKTMHRKAERVSSVLLETDALRVKRGQQQALLSEQKKNVELERLHLEHLLHRHSSLQAVVRADQIQAARELAELASRSDDLQGIIDVLESASTSRDRAKPDADDFEAVDTNLTNLNDSLAAIPVPPKASHAYYLSGPLIRRFGERLENGIPSQGVLIRVDPGTFIPAPRAGKVVFSGDFRTYGRLLIIKHAGGYHSLFAGFSHIYSTIGTLVNAGEPVGVMGGLEDQSNTMLYIEVRQEGSPINPQEWLEFKDRKVSG